MFQFSRLPFLAEYPDFIGMGCPIRTSMDLRSFASPHSFSQLTTSFIVSTSLGIPRTPFFASFFLLFLSASFSLLPLSFLLIIFTPALSMNFLAYLLPPFQILFLLLGLFCLFIFFKPFPLIRFVFDLSVFTFSQPFDRVFFWISFLDFLIWFFFWFCLFWFFCGG
jgi:hypothetical protein